MSLIIIRFVLEPLKLNMERFRILEATLVWYAAKKVSSPIRAWSKFARDSVYLIDRTWAIANSHRAHILYHIGQPAKCDKGCKRTNMTRGHLNQHVRAKHSDLLKAHTQVVNSKKWCPHDGCQFSKHNRHGNPGDKLWPKRLADHMKSCKFGKKAAVLGATTNDGRAPNSERNSPGLSGATRVSNASSSNAPSSNASEIKHHMSDYRKRNELPPIVPYARSYLKDDQIIEASSPDQQVTISYTCPLKNCDQIKTELDDIR